ncbi:MAG: transposase [Devosia sp.]
MDAPMELLTNGGRRRRNRQWPDVEKARIVSETLRPGAIVGEVAQRHGLKANHVSSWRRWPGMGSWCCRRQSILWSSQR